MNKIELEPYLSKASQLEKLKLQVLFREADTDRCGELQINQLRLKLIQIFKNLGMDFTVTDQQIQG